MLSRQQIRSFYDRFGAKQDAQAFYEDPAVEELIAHSDFSHADNLLEFGFGTGRLAERLMSGPLPSDAIYRGVDLSPNMVALATERLAPFGKRVRLDCGDETSLSEIPDHSVDRFVSTYVLDLMPDDQIKDVLAAAHRLLTPTGKLCLVSLTNGATGLPRVVTAIWSAIFRARPTLVGGCRPIDLARLVGVAAWRLDHRQLVSAFGIPSEVVVAMPADPESSSGPRESA